MQRAAHRAEDYVGPQQRSLHLSWATAGLGSSSVAERRRRSQNHLSPIVSFMSNVRRKAETMGLLRLFLSGSDAYAEKGTCSRRAPELHLCQCVPSITDRRRDGFAHVTRLILNNRFANDTRVSISLPSGLKTGRPGERVPPGGWGCSPICLSRHEKQELPAHLTALQVRSTGPTQACGHGTN
jgi:hypothetical protein